MTYELTIDYNIELCNSRQHEQTKKKDAKKNDQRKKTN